MTLMSSDLAETELWAKNDNKLFQLGPGVEAEVKMCHALFYKEIQIQNLTL